MGILQHHATISLSENHILEKVNSYFEDGIWNIQKLKSVLPWEMVHKSASIHSERVHSGPDRVIWGASKTGTFSVKSAYGELFHDSSYPDWRWKFIWNLKIPPKILSFLWTLLHGKTLTNAQRVVRGLSSDIICPRCKDGDEDREHLFRSCGLSVTIWEDIYRGVSRTPIFKGDFDDWLFLNLMNNSKVDDIFASYILFALGLWFIWKLRCKYVFENKFALSFDQKFCVRLAAGKYGCCLIQSCKMMIDVDSCCKVQHTYRESNRLADNIAKIGHTMGYGNVFFDDTPSQVTTVFEADMLGLVMARQVALPG
ncbi:hypothetical protein Ddye_012984 [Dipteronia dyeriana]|uniref:Reverse transcriptase zinc-binding domain-containing protein n=1 Tax=Dipteronia dyeriana TaxID=168575 RepID=A0AAE0CJR6_9ROSI|nr:hypothetical protein Ddye_012984 [Dipteronia dyeriana]